jgi:hypothetical protein
VYYFNSFGSQVVVTKRAYGMLSLLSGTYSQYVHEAVRFNDKKGTKFKQKLVKSTRVGRKKARQNNFCHVFGHSRYQISNTSI